MTKSFDILIVGAGPAGLMAAIRLAKMGATVAVFEKETFPHIKTCGDLVTLEGLGLLEDIGLGPWMADFRRVDVLRFSAPDGSLIDISCADPQESARNRILPREFLDAKLAETAVANGVNLFDGCKVQDVVLAADGVQVKANKESFSGKFLLLADGSHAPITRKLGLLREDADLMAARQYLKAPAVDTHGPLEFHFQAKILPGYTWLFPEGNGQVNLGAGTYTRRVRSSEIDLFRVLEAFKTHDPVLADRLKNAKPVGTMKAFPLRTHLGGTQTHGDRFMVLGDAAGLVSPFTGEGITSGMLSGALAANVLQKAFNKGQFTAAQTAEYTKTLKLRFEGDHQAAYTLRATLKNPRLLNRFFHAMRRDAELARLFALTYLDEKSPQLLLHARNLVKIIKG
ncbi:MAG: NAD(P)/FAD-dependent oxidoreductase [Anaerolineae bacterium]|jgi:geranylgeranyl reductase family protein|nr:NAD(P)/FAD-dependent oxidoreductase [Anaerolineae bacterium]